MAVHVGELQSDVELLGVPATGAGAARGGAVSATAPTWQERDRARRVAELATRDTARVAGEGVGG